MSAMPNKAFLLQKNVNYMEEGSGGSETTSEAFSRAHIFIPSHFLWHHKFSLNHAFNFYGVLLLRILYNVYSPILRWILLVICSTATCKMQQQNVLCCVFVVLVRTHAGNSHWIKLKNCC